jgi:hypothetical protein
MSIWPTSALPWRTLTSASSHVLLRLRRIASPVACRFSSRNLRRLATGMTRPRYEPYCTYSNFRVRIRYSMAANGQRQAAEGRDRAGERAGAEAATGAAAEDEVTQ